MKKILLIGMTEEKEALSKPLSECNGFDPYNFEEKDLNKTNALQSSLWEIAVSFLRIFIGVFGENSVKF
jgi:hypothetical protein